MRVFALLHVSVLVAHGLQLACDETGVNPILDNTKEVPVVGDSFKVGVWRHRSTVLSI